MTERKTLTTRERALRQVPEAEVQRRVQEILTMYQWWWYHAPDNRPGSKTGRVQRIRAGFPDIIAVRGTRILVLELKRETGHTTDDQDAVLAMFQLTGKVETYVIRPSNIDTLLEIAAPEWQR
jgi:hypothetical protein